MRLIDKDKNKRIITEDDILLSDGENTLSGRFSDMDQEINDLKANLKWIYKYGGVGSGGSGGGGGGTVKEFNIFAQLNGIQLKDNTIVLPSGTSQYPLHIKINNPNGLEYHIEIKYTHTDSNGNTQTVTNSSQILNVTNNYTYDTNLSLNNNDTLTINATSSYGETQQVSCSYITQSYIFSMSLVNDNYKDTQNKNNIKTLASDVFMSTANNEGVNVRLDYQVSIALASDITYTYTFMGKEQTGVISKDNKTGFIIFPVDKSLFVESKSGYYAATMKFSIIPEGQVTAMEETRTIAFNLIPDGLYCQFLPQDDMTIYQTETSDPVLAAPGNHAFSIKIYQGTNSNRFYNVTVYLNDVQVYNTTIQERKVETFTIYSNQKGVNKIRVATQGLSGGSVEQTYYMYIQESLSTVDWLDPYWNLRYSYRSGNINDRYDGKDHADGIFKNYKSQPYIEQNTLKGNVLIGGIVNTGGTGVSDATNTMVSIGLQYSAINNTDNPIIQLNATTGSSSQGNTVLTVYYNKVSFTSESTNLCIRTEADADYNNSKLYHLLQIYSQYIGTKNNDHYYQVSYYLDGILEGVFAATNTSLKVNQIMLCAGNYAINTLEVDYYDMEELKVTNPDAEVYQYYLAYQNSLGNMVLNDAKILEAVKKFNVGLDGRVTTDRSTIDNLIAYSKVPIMMFSYQNAKNQDIIEELERAYAENDSVSTYDVGVYWGKAGAKSLTQVKVPDETLYSNASFRIKIQGSSTKGYKVKNFNLSLDNVTTGDTNATYLFSPNFKEDDTSTFLPEQEFTLKADVVDSSHSNNTSCGKFVNTVCKKFSDSMVFEGNSNYRKYIKNCLEGFPFLLFLESKSGSEEDGSVVYQYYYLGVYNFNLGRSSYYNLGYKDLTVFDGTKKGDKTEGSLTSSRDSFTFFRVEYEKSSLLKGLGVAEIQGGSTYYDFSQYDNTVLFPQAMTGGGTDNSAMFGDFVPSNDGGMLSSLQSFVKQVSKSGGYLFDYLKKIRGPQEEGFQAATDDGGSKNQVPDHTKQYIRKNLSTYVFDKNVDAGTATDVNKLILGDADQNIPPMLNFQSLSEYYTICMALGLLDSVEKNLNVKTWDQKTWFIAFYDMDTCLGVDNAGDDADYFAFSDYWKSTYTTTPNNVEEPTGVTIYRDFSPNGTKGFDIPSSFLFAVAKYGYYAMLDDTGNLVSDYVKDYPQELYARWRSAKHGNNNEGVLVNADYFMDNFFSNNLGSIIPAVISYNYRSKYIVMDKALTLDTVNFAKFKGSRINKVREWLNGRLHLLDAYFNLNTQINTPIQYRDSKTGQWLNLSYGSSGSENNILDIHYNPNSTYSLKENNDIIILHDIFSTENTQGVQLNKKVDITIKCPLHSPLQIVSPTKTYNYVLGGNNLQHIMFEATGVQTFTIGGSASWTYLENIDWLATSASREVYINSAKLDKIEGNQGQFNGITLITPSAENISLRSSGYKGKLTLSNKNGGFPNLKTLNISNTALTLNAESLNCTSITATNINNSQAEIQITACNNLERFSVENSRIKTLNLISVPLKTVKLTNQNIAVMNINRSSYDADSSLVITDNTVVSITVSNFAKVTIQDCPKLETVVVTTGVTNLSVINCNNTNLKIVDNASKTTVGLLDLSGLVEKPEAPGLEQVCFRSCTHITKAILPGGVKLAAYAFADTSLKTLDALNGKKLIMLGEATFSSTYYALKDSNGDYTLLTVSSATKSLKSTFAQCLLTTVDANYFIDNSIPADNSITDISFMFYNCHNVKYTLEQMQEDLAEGSTSHHYINLSKFTKVISADCLFKYSEVKVLNSKLLNFGTYQGAGISMNGFLNSTGLYGDAVYQPVYVTLDCFKNIIQNITSLAGYNTAFEAATIICDNQGQVIPDNEEINLSELLNPDGKSPEKLTNFYFFVFNTQTLNLKGTFTAQWKSLSRLGLITHKYKGIDGLLHDIDHPFHIGEFLTTKQLDDRIDLWEFINWEGIITKYKDSGIELLNALVNYAEGASSFTFNKYISIDNYDKLCNLLIDTRFVNLPYLFQNCNIVLGDAANRDFTFGTFGSNNTISNISAMYENCYLTKDKDGNEQVPMLLSSETFSHLTGLKQVIRAFSNCKIGSGIPFNFFNKRKTNRSNVYIKEGTVYKPAILTQYTYDKTIFSFYAIFRGATFDNSGNKSSLYFNPVDYSAQIQPNSVVANGVSYSEYYDRNSYTTPEGETAYTYTKRELSKNYEYEDCQGLTGYYLAQVKVNNNGDTFVNPSIASGSEKGLIIPPDFFMCATTDASNTGLKPSYEEAFACKTPLSGIIPEHIFSAAPGINCKNVFKGQVVIPRLLKSVTNTDSKGKTLIEKAWSHYPSNYTTYQNLEEAFTSKFICPQDNELLGASTERNYCVIIQQDSIPPNVTSLKNAFYSDQFTQGNNNGGQVMGGINEINFIGNYTFGDNSIQIRWGFNFDYFTSLRADYLFTGTLNAVCFGDLFTTSTSVNSDVSLLERQRDDTNNAVMQYYAWYNSPNHLSSQITLPATKNSISWFVESDHSKNIYIKSTQLPQDATSQAFYDRTIFKVKDE